MTTKTILEMKRLSDNLIYSFSKEQTQTSTIYRRSDKAVCISFKPEHGWAIWDESQEFILGRPWDVLPQYQKDYPPEGRWVSCKGSKSYVYELKYTS